MGVDVPIRQDGRTLGAFDFIVRTADGAYQHWEIAVKFYCCWETQCIGITGLVQTRETVSTRSIGWHHQIPLARRTAALEVLHAFGATWIEQHVALLKGTFCGGGDRLIGPPHASMAPSGLWVCEGDVASVNHNWTRLDTETQAVLACADRILCRWTCMISYKTSLDRKCGHGSIISMDN